MDGALVKMRRRFWRLVMPSLSAVTLEQIFQAQSEIDWKNSSKGALQLPGETSSESTTTLTNEENAASPDTSSSQKLPSN